MSYLLTTLTKKQEVDSIIRSTIDKKQEVDSVSLLLDDVLAKFATVALVDVDSDDVQVYLDITLIPSTIFFFNAHHIKMDSGTADHTKWIGAFRTKQDFIDVVEAIFRGAMKGKLIVNCPLPPERVPRYQLYYNDVYKLPKCDGSSWFFFVIAHFTPLHKKQDFIDIVEAVSKEEWKAS